MNTSYSHGSATDRTVRALWLGALFGATTVLVIGTGLAWYFDHQAHPGTTSGWVSFLVVSSIGMLCTVGYFVQPAGLWEELPHTRLRAVAASTFVALRPRSSSPAPGEQKAAS